MVSSAGEANSDQASGETWDRFSTSMPMGWVEQATATHGPE